MNENARPGKEKAARQDGQSCSTGSTSTLIAGGPQRRISDEILRRWFVEAERLSRLHRRSGNSRHLKAFCRHLAGALTHVARSLP
jgi:hypothetical protein